MVKYVLCVLAILGVLAVTRPPLYATPTLAEYRIIRSEGHDDFLDFYLAGIGEGFSLINSEYKHDNQPLLYCQPKDVDLTVADYRKIFDNEIKRTSYHPQVNVEKILLTALKHKFPCHKK